MSLLLFFLIDPNTKRRDILSHRSYIISFRGIIEVRLMIVFLITAKKQGGSLIILKKIRSCL